MMFVPFVYIKAFGYAFGFGGWERQIREKKRWVTVFYPPFVCNPLLLVITQSKIFVLHFVAFGREGIWYMFPSSPFVLCESESYWVYVGFGFES